MTSNAGANRIISPKTLGFGHTNDVEEEYKKMKAGVLEEVKHIFKPEFINRVDEMIVFHVLSKDNIHEVARIMAGLLIKRVTKQLDIELVIHDEVIDHVAKKGFDKDYGARPLRRTLQSEVEDALAEEVINGKIRIGDKVGVYMEDGKVVIKK